jgi:hypothetical protein
MLISRSAKVTNETPSEGGIIRVSKPKRISLVGLPANQTAFKVVRSDDKGEPKMTQTIVRRTKRSATPSPVLKLTFPEGTTEDNVKSALTNYGMSDYTVSEQDGVYVALRSDLKSISNDTATQDIKLSDEGLIATVAKIVSRSDDEKSQLSLVALEFDSSKFTLEEVQRWSTEKCVDGKVEEPQNPDQCYVVRRSEVPEGEETRKMVLEDGVTALITRSDVSNVPDGFVAVISEAAYGSWGWGQLDFAAMMADKEFSEAMEDSMYALRDLLRHIIMWSGLPLDVRKDLANRALAQYGEYVGAVMDSLPRQLLVSVVRSANPRKETAMTKATSGTATPEAKPEDKTAPETLTRSDVQTMITEAVAAALAAKPVARSDEKPEAKPEEKPAAPVVLTRADFQEMLSAVVTPLAEKVEKLGSTTVLRSADEQKVERNDADDKDDKKDKKKDVFRGAFPGLRREATA